MLSFCVIYTSYAPHNIFSALPYLLIGVGIKSSDLQPLNKLAIFIPFGLILYIFDDRIHFNLFYFNFQHNFVMTFVYESKLRKTTIVYDKDVGLAYEIEKAFQSPVKRSNHSSPRSSPDANQCCCSCLELIGGRLWTCARCGSSFHSICHFPPLPINTHRTNQSDWMCHRCQQEMQYERHPQRLKFNSDPQEREDALNHSFVQFLLRLYGKNGKPSEEFADFIIALQAINAREFSLDKLGVDECYYKLPFDELFSRDEPCPSPSKKCFYCQRYVENRMIACDFCDAVFCFDCPNPPFTALPNERWMCALHVEPFLDTHLLSSMRITDRMALWKEHIALPSGQSKRVIMDFFKKLKEEEKNGKAMLKGNANNKMATKVKTFKVDKLVKAAYERAHKINSGEECFPNIKHEERGQKIEIGTSAASSSLQNHVATIGPNDEKLSDAVEALIAMQNQPTSVDVEMDEGPSTSSKASTSVEPCDGTSSKTSTSADETNEFRFNPRLLDKKLPVFAALHILSGADRNLATSRFLIPIQSEFITLGPLCDSLHAINLSRFTSCKQLEEHQALIFFDKAKSCFEMVSASLFLDDDSLLAGPRPRKRRRAATVCNCQRNSSAADDPVLLLLDSTTQVLVPSPKPAVLWNGAVIRIGCLHLHFVGIGIL